MDDTDFTMTFVRGEPCVALWNGMSMRFYTDNVEPGHVALTQIERAVAVARLRALANVLEATDE